MLILDHITRSSRDEPGNVGCSGRRQLMRVVNSMVRPPTVRAHKENEFKCVLYFVDSCSSSSVLVRVVRRQSVHPFFCELGKTNCRNVS
jgi:hypothetical protein